MEEEFKKKHIEYVLAVDNVEYPIHKCILIENKYYVKGSVGIKDSGQAYRINNVWKHTNFTWDYSINKYVDINVTPLYFGYINKDKEKGFFSDVTNSITVKNELYINPSIIDEPKVRSIHSNKFLQYILLSQCVNFDPSSGNYVATIADKFLCGVGLNSNKKYSIGEVSYYSNSDIYKGTDKTVYSLSDLSQEIKKDVFSRFEKKQLSTRPVYLDLSRKIPYSIGIEFETSKGTVEDFKLAECGLFPLKDGSIQGSEYVSVPYTPNTKIVDNIVRSCLHLVNNTIVDHNCSLHVHFGNLPKDRLFILSLYKLWYELESEMNMLNIINKRNFKFINSKKSNEKDHCQPIPDLVFPKIMDSKAVSEMYAKLVSVVNGGTYPNKNTCPKNKTHVYSGKPKWNIAGRYFTLNVLNYLFGNGTVEFRLHKGTVNPYKVINYILILNAIVQYSQRHSSKIFDIYSRPTLKDVLYHTYENTNLFTYLTEYIEERKNKYFEEYTDNSNNLGGGYVFSSDDYEYDNVYKFIDSSGFDILDKERWIEILGPYEKPLPFKDQERFPFTFIENPDEKEENKKNILYPYSYTYKKLNVDEILKEEMEEIEEEIEEEMEF